MLHIASACRATGLSLALLEQRLEYMRCNKEKLVGKSVPQIFKGVTPEQYARLVEKARGAGIDLSGPSGTASKFGVEVAWNYVAGIQELTLHCLKAPFFMSTADVDARIQALVKESLA